MNILQCHSKGDRRFSALYAKVTIDGKTDTIENFYQKSKRNKNGLPVKKGEPVTYMEFRKLKLPPYFLSDFYDLLWIQYFIENKDLYDYAKTFDDYRDIFKGSSINNQENTIRKICKFGIKKVKEDCADFMTIINSGEPIIYKDALLCKEDVLAHQTNCKGVMGAGIAKDVRAVYPEVYRDYKNYCDSFENDIDILGTLRISDCKNGKKVANIFGQYSYNRYVKQTIDAEFKKAVILLHTYVKDNSLTVCFPYKIGCNLAGGDWDTIYGILKEVFCDYPFILYKKG